MGELILAVVPRCDGGEFRIYRKVYRGRPYIELSSWSPESEGGQRLRWVNLRRGELRPLTLALLAALKSMGLGLHPESIDQEAAR